MPMDECLQYLDSAPEKVFAKAYDLVLNGTELSSGSIRINDYEQLFTVNYRYSQHIKAVLINRGRA